MSKKLTGMRAMLTYEPILAEQALLLGRRMIRRRRILCWLQTLAVAAAAWGLIVLIERAF